MKLLFLGTGAADWDPDPQNTEGIRRMSSAMVDDDLLIDVAPASYKFFKHLGKDESKITKRILTHSHEDHLSPRDLSGFASLGSVKFWCHEGVQEKLANMNISNLEVYTLSPFAKVKEGNYTITPLPANHWVEDTCEVAFHYIIEKDGKKLFYGCDGGWFLDRTWCCIREQKFDCAVLECTVGDDNFNWRIGSHNGISMVRLLAGTMRKNGILGDNSKLLVSHMAKTLHDSIENTEKKLEKYGITAAFDGLEVTI